MSERHSGKGPAERSIPIDGIRQTCSVPGCQRPTSRAEGLGLAAFLCRYHVGFRARHGSPWCPTYKSADLKPYLASAGQWVREHRGSPAVTASLAWLRGLLDGAGRVEPAQSIKRLPAAVRAKIALARLREAGIEPERLLVIHLAVSALIEDDRDSHRTEEFRDVQVAKAVHRLASGTHRRWDFPMPDGSTQPLHMHVYPRSAGLVLRRIGEAIAEHCREVAAIGLAPVRAIRRDRFGLHPSAVSGWKPRWARQRGTAR